MVDHRATWYGPTLDLVQIPDFRLSDALFPDDAVTVLGVLAGDSPTLLPVPGSEPLAAQLSALGVTGKAGELVRAVLAIGTRQHPVALLGLGTEPPRADSWRSAVGAAARALSSTAHVAIAAPKLDAELAEAIATGFALGGYRFQNYLADPPATTSQLSLSAAATPELRESLDRARIISSAVWLVRDLVNTPANDLGPDALAQLAASTVAGLGIEAEVLTEHELAEGGFGGLLGVGAGSVRPPRLVVLRHRPPAAVARIALIGKGITFDTGGLSLKPAASMVGMKFDMAGAAAVLGVICALAQLGVPVELTGYLALAENMPSGQALRPDDIIAIHGGTTVEITNTDAEGRLVLADAIVAASAEQPDVIIDVATLTGAQVVALGERTAGVLGNDAAWITRLTEAGDTVGEPAWHMPIPDEVGKALESEVAELANAARGNRAAGMSTAAWFLRRFVGQRADGGGPIPWVHLDIAGPANNERAPYGVTPKGATGVPVRTLIEAIESLASAAEHQPVRPGGAPRP